MTMSETTGATIEPWLREILRCPACRSELDDDATGTHLSCRNAECALVYRIDEGIPVLLVDEAVRAGD